MSSLAQEYEPSGELKELKFPPEREASPEIDEDADDVEILNDGDDEDLDGTPLGIV